MVELKSSAVEFQSTRPSRDGTMFWTMLRTFVCIFQSTRPSRDGTSITVGCLSIHSLFQSTRPSRDGTAELSWADHEDAWISIHPSLAGRDRAEPVRFIPSVLFQSTRPSRDGTFRKRDQRKRSDHFNPPVPRGTGRKRFEASGCTETFQSTRPSRDGTPGSVQCPFDGEISIHPSLAGRDWQNWLRT